MTAVWYRWDGEDVVVLLRVQPRARSNEIIGTHGSPGSPGSHSDVLKVRITAPPVDGAANAELIEWFARLCKVPKAQISIEAGDSGRNKRVRIRAPVQLLPGMERQ